MLRSTVISKIEKVNRYVREPDRVSIQKLDLMFQGDNDRHAVSLADGAWRCDCHFFAAWGSCCHISTLQKMFGKSLPLSAQEDLVEHLSWASAHLMEINSERGPETQRDLETR